MANRSYVRNQMSLEKSPVCLYARVSIGASGDPTLQVGPPSKCLGIYSMTRTGAGAYTIKLGFGATSVDTYQRLMSAQAVSLDTADPSWAMMTVTADNSAVLSVPDIRIKFFDFAGVAADPASGSVLLLKFEFSNTSVI